MGVKEKQQTTHHGQGGKGRGEAALGQQSPAPRSTPTGGLSSGRAGRPLPGPGGGDSRSKRPRRPDLGGTGESRRRAAPVLPQGPAAARRHGRLRHGRQRLRAGPGSCRLTPGTAQPGRGQGDRWEFLLAPKKLVVNPARRGTACPEAGLGAGVGRTSGADPGWAGCRGGVTAAPCRDSRPVSFTPPSRPAGSSAPVRRPREAGARFSQGVLVSVRRNVNCVAFTHLCVRDQKAIYIYIYLKKKKKKPPHNKTA